jgi:hypothetical protein
MGTLSLALPLDDPKWGQLTHAYGSAGDIPPLLRQLLDFPSSQNYKDEPWYTLWSSLCHQGDVYPASFAAVPHIIMAAAADPTPATYSYFLLPASIEIARVKGAVPIPEYLDTPYFQSLALVPGILAGAADQDWDEDFCSSALAALAAAKGHPSMGEIIRELDGGTVSEALRWLHSR